MSDKVIKRNSWIAKCLPFIEPIGILPSTGHINRLGDSNFDSRHPIILDTRHAIVWLLVKHLHIKNFHQGLGYMSAVVNFEIRCVKFAMVAAKN